jgi:hypothetical protein
MTAPQGQRGVVCNPHLIPDQPITDYQLPITNRPITNPLGIYQER